MSIDINFSLADPELGSLNINRLNNSIELLYPCSDQINCTCYKGVFDPGTYFVELYGASGGRTATPYRFENNTFIDQSIVKYYKGNAVPLDDNSSRGGAGGYTSGCLIIPRRTTMFIHLGGEGTFGKNFDKGGYNGG